MASGFYNTGIEKLVNPNLAGAIDLIDDTIKLLLVRDTYSFDPDHDFVSNVSSAELAVTGYTGGFSGSGRKTLTGKSLARNDTSNRTEYDATDVTWVALGTGQTIGGIVVYKNGTSDSDSQLIAFFDITDQATNGLDFTVQWGSAGLFNF